MPIGGKDAFLSKVTFRRESNWISKTKQMLKDMKTIAEINEIAPYHPCEWQQGYGIWQAGYMAGQKNGATEQKAIDDIRIKELEAKEKALKKWIEENSEPIYEEGVEPWNGIVKEKLLEFLDNYGKEE